MELVSPLENIMLKAGPTRISGAAILAEPPDLQSLYLQVAAIVDRVSRLRSTFKPFWFWHVRRTTDIDVGNHIKSLKDSGISEMRDVERLVEEARRLALPDDRPPWLIVVVNGIDRDGVRPTGLPVLLFHFDHSIADGIRALEILTRFPSDPRIMAVASARPETRNFDLGRIAALADLDADERISPMPVACVSVDLSTSKTVRGARQDLSDHIIGAVNSVLADPDLFDRDVAPTGKMALIRLTRRQVQIGELGNHVSAVYRAAVTEGAQAVSRRGMLPSLAAERTSQARQIWLSPFPRRLVRMATRQWYSQFDALLTIVPGGQKAKTFGSASINRIYGVLPFLADIRLNVTVVVYGNKINLTLMPNAHFIGDKALLASRMRDALTIRKAREPSELDLTPFAHRRRRGRTTFKAGY